MEDGVENIMNSFSPFYDVVKTFMGLYGGDSVLIHVGDSVYDPNTSTQTNVEDLYNVRTLAFDYVSKFDGFTTHPNSLIKTGDKQIFMKPLDFAPDPRVDVDFIEAGGVRRRIISCKKLSPDNSNVLLFELFTREE